MCRYSGDWRLETEVDEGAALRAMGACFRGADPKIGAWASLIGGDTVRK